MQLTKQTTIKWHPCVNCSTLDRSPVKKWQRTSCHHLCTMSASSPLPSSASSLSLCLQIQSIVATAIIIATWHQASAECDPCRLKSGLGVGRHAPHLHLYAAQGRRGWSMPTIIIFIIISIGITTIVGVFPRIHPPPSPPHPLQR